MNMGAGQPASLPYGVKPQRWYSYHSMQFSSPLQQSPIFSVCYHQPPSGNYPSPNHYPPPLHFTQLNSYPYPPPPMPNPYSAYAYQPHIIPTNQFVPPPHTTHEPTPNPQPCSVPLQLDRVTNPEVPVVDLSPSSSQFSDARIDEFIESMIRLFDNFISKCMKGIRVSEGSSPSVPTQTTKLKSSEPRVYSPLWLQPVTKSSSLLGDAQSLSVSMSQIKQACGEANSATGGVKNRRHQKRNKSLLKGLVVSSRLGNIVSVQMNNTYSVSGAKSSGVDMICDNKKRSSGVKVEMDNGDGKELDELEGISVKQGEIQGSYSCDNALSLLDKMSKSDRLGFAGETTTSVMSIRDKGGGHAHQPLELAIVVNNAEEDDIQYVQNQATPNFNSDFDDLAGNFIERDFGQLFVPQGHVAGQQPVPAIILVGTLPMMHQMSIVGGGAAPLILYESSSMSVMPLSGVTSCKPCLTTMEMPACTMKNERLVSKLIINSALCKRVKHYTEGSPKISHYALQLCFSGFDKKVCDKGSGHPLLTVLHKEFTVGNVRLLWLLKSVGIKYIRVDDSEKRPATVLQNDVNRFIFGCNMFECVQTESSLCVGATQNSCEYILNALVGDHGQVRIKAWKNARASFDTGKLEMKAMQGVLQRYLYDYSSELVENRASNLEKCDLLLRNILRAWEDKIFCYGDEISIQLLRNLLSNQLYQYVKPPTVSCLGAQALIMIFNSLHKCMGYLPFEDFNHPAKPWYVYMFLDLEISLCVIKSRHIVANTTNSCCLHLYMLFVFLLIMLGAGVIALNHDLKMNDILSSLGSQRSMEYEKEISELGADVQRDVKENWIEDTTALCNDAEGLSLIPSATQSLYCNGKAKVLVIISKSKLACMLLIGLPFSRLVLLLCSYIDKRRGKRTGAFSVYMEPDHANIFDNDRNGGFMVDNEDVRATIVEHKDGMLIGEDDGADRDKKFGDSYWKICVYVQLLLLAKKTSSTNCPPIFAVQPCACNASHILET